MGYQLLQDWVMELPGREQGTMLGAIRSCDTAPKEPDSVIERYGCSTGECSPERTLTAYMRYLIFNPPDPREVDIPGSFYSRQPPKEWKPSLFGHYPLHWFAHLMHAFEVVGYRHPDPITREVCETIYRRMVRSLHLEPEKRADMIIRLSEDRISNGTVVS